MSDERDSLQREIERLESENAELRRQLVAKKVDGPSRQSVEEWKEAERQINAEKEATTARMIAANRAMLSEQINNAAKLSQIVQRWALVPSDDLSAVRQDISRTASVVQAMAAALNLYGEEKPPKNETDALSEQENKLRDLLVRERELMKPANG